MARNLEAIASALRGHLPQGARITGVAPLTTGFSNDTYLIEGLDLILRLPPHAGAMLDGHGVIAQARIYQELGQAAGAAPVPGIADICEDTQVLGDPFFVMRRVDGESIDDLKMLPWFVDGSDALRTQVCRGWITAFAANAKLAPLAVLGDAVCPEHDAQMWQEFARQGQLPAAGRPV